MAAKLYDTTRMSRYYNGPVSDHFDGARFFDPHGAPPRSRRDLLRWFVDRHWRATTSTWPAWAPSPYADRPPACIDVVLVSHGHYDHLDLTTLSRLAAAHRARVITPLGNDTIMRNHDSAIRAEAHDWENRVDIGAGIAARRRRCPARRAEPPSRPGIFPAPRRSRHRSCRCRCGRGRPTRTERT